jgi:hypothetical protein
VVRRQAKSRIAKKTGWDEEEIVPKTFFRRLNENLAENVIGKRKASKKILINWYAGDDFF